MKREISTKRARVYIFRFLCVIFLGALAFQFHMFLLFTRDQRMTVEMRTVHDYEGVLCKFSGTRKRSAAGGSNACPKQGIVTSFKEGDLCNNMWQYANIIAGSITTGLDGYVPVCFINTLGQLFDNLTVPLLSKIGHCNIALPEAVSTIEDWSDPNQSIVIWESDLFNDHVMTYLDLIKKEFVFNSVLSRITFSILRKAKGNAKNVTYIGVYITNTMIIVDQEYDGFNPSVQFFLEAMDEFRREFPNALFVVIVDHQEFWKSIFKDRNDVFIMSEDSLNYFGATLSILAHCNHTILSSDGIAVWGAILSGGRTIVSLYLSEDFNNLIQRKEDWNYLINNSNVENKDFEKFL